MEELERQTSEKLEPEEPGMDAMEEDEDEDEEMFAPRVVDVAMTGMGEPWMAGGFM
jgi:hypothetical protein